MKKSIFLSILIIFVALSLVIVTPLTLFGDTILDSDICWSIDRPGTYSNMITYSNQSTYYSQIYDYTSSSNWVQIGAGEPTTRYYQLPSPFASSSSVQITQAKNSPVYTNNSGGLSTIGFGFNQNIFTIFDSLQPSNDDYVCFAVFMSLEQPISQVKFTLGELVTGSSYQDTGISIDDRYIQYDPNNINGGTSAVIDTSLWGTPSSTRYFVVFYWNVLYSDFKSIQNTGNGNSKAFILSFKTPSRSRALICDPILYKASSNYEATSLTLINNINDNVQTITDVLNQGSYTAPPDTSNIDDVIQHGGGKLDEYLYMHVGEVDTVYRGIDFTTISSGLAWYSDTLATIYARLTFLKGIYGVILIFMIFNLLKGGVLQKVNDNEEEKPVTMRIYEGK